MQTMQTTPYDAITIDTIVPDVSMCVAPLPWPLRDVASPWVGNVVLVAGCTGDDGWLSTSTPCD